MLMRVAKGINLKCGAKMTRLPSVNSFFALISAVTVLTFSYLHFCASILNILVNFCYYAILRLKQV